MGNRTIGIPFQLYSINITRYKALYVSSRFNYRHAILQIKYTFSFRNIKRSRPYIYETGCKQMRWNFLNQEINNDVNNNYFKSCTDNQKIIIIILFLNVCATSRKDEFGQNSIFFWFTNLMVYKQSKLFITEAIKATSKYNFEKKNLRRSCIILNGKYYRQEKEE